MQIRTISRLALAGAVATMLAASTAGVRAQDAAAAPMAMSTTTSGSMDYSLLNNRHYDYIDLQQAKARGLSDSQIATIAKIANKTGTPFREVSAAVERGETFPSLAGKYNLKLADVYENDKEKQEVADYTSLYESVGTKNGMSGASMMDASMPMSGSTDNMASAGTPGSDMSGSAMTTPAMTSLDIVDTAMAAKNLTTLVKALQVAGLVETLKGAGPFTVFAPSDRAFAKLPAGQLDALLADPVKLKNVLTYHVIPASIMAADANAMSTPTSPPTVQGGTLQVTKDDKGHLKVNEATITKADIKASNGVIHIINEVLMPTMDAPAPMAPAADGAMPPAAPMAPAPPAAPAQ